MSTPAGWYPDPTGRHQNRWFDGNDWTDQVADGQVVGVDPVRGAPAEAAATQPEAAAPTAPEPVTPEPTPDVTATQAVAATAPQPASPPPGAAGVATPPPGAPGLGTPPPGAPGAAPPGVPPGYVSPDAADGGGRNKTLLIVGAVVVVVALAVGLVLALGGGDGDGDGERDEASSSAPADDEEEEEDDEPSASDLFDDMADSADTGDDDVFDSGDTADTTPPSDGSYPPEVITNFLNACTSSGASATLCQCTIDVLQRDVPFDRFVEIDGELRTNPNVVPPELTAAVNECQ